eukprot:gene1047-622_t
MMRELREHFHREPYTWARSTDHRKRAALWDEGRFQDYLAHYLLIAHLSCLREMHVSAGRMDVQIWTAAYEYILELKVRESGGKRDSALEQAKKYAAERTSLGKPKIFVGIVFSKWLKNISKSLGEKEKLDGMGREAFMSMRRLSLVPNCCASLPSSFLVSDRLLGFTVFPFSLRSVCIEWRRKKKR